MSNYKWIKVKPNKTQQSKKINKKNIKKYGHP